MLGKVQREFSLDVKDVVAARVAADAAYHERLRKLEEKYSWLGPVDHEELFQSGRNEYKRLFPDKFIGDSEDEQREQKNIVSVAVSCEDISETVDTNSESEEMVVEDTASVLQNYVYGVVFTDRLVLVGEGGLIGGVVRDGEKEEDALNRYSVEQTGVKTYDAKRKGSFVEGKDHCSVYLIPFVFNLDMSGLYADGHEALFVGFPRLESCVTYLQALDPDVSDLVDIYGKDPPTTIEQWSRSRVIIEELMKKDDGLTFQNIHWVLQENARKLHRCNLETMRFLFRRKGKYINLYLRYVVDERRGCDHECCDCSLAVYGINQFEGYEYHIKLIDRRNVVDFLVDISLQYKVEEGEISQRVRNDPTGKCDCRFSEVERIVCGIVRTKGPMFPTMMRAKLRAVGIRIGRGQLIRFIRSERSGLQLGEDGKILLCDDPKVTVESRQLYELRQKKNGGGDSPDVLPFD